MSIPTFKEFNDLQESSKGQWWKRRVQTTQHNVSRLANIAKNAPDLETKLDALVQINQNTVTLVATMIAISANDRNLVR